MGGGTSDGGRAERALGRLMRSTLLLATLASCTQNHPYRMVGSPATGWQTVPVSPIERGTDYCRFYDDRQSPYRTGDRIVPSVEHVQDHGTDLYELGYVEIDDHGNQFAPTQLSSSLESLRPDDDAGVIMVTYVHGWNHNAHPCDRDVRNFRLVLEALADDEIGAAWREKRTPRHVRGMYIAWRGRSFRGINPLTFWARKAGAHRVGQRSAISVFTRIQSFAEEVSRQAPQSKFVTIGHSFGAAVVHNALEARLVPELAAAADAAARGEPVPLVRGLGHVTVLLNPAFEAARYRHAHELAREVERSGGFHVDQRPVLLILTSAADWATRYTFRFGMRMRRHRGQFIRDERGDEKQEYLTAVGHYRPFHTPHVRVDCSERTRTSDMSVDDMEFFDRRGNQAEAPEEVLGETCSVEGWGPGVSMPLLSVYDREGDVMAGHNDIFNPTVQALIWRFVRDVDGPPLIDRVDPPSEREPELEPEPEPEPVEEGVTAEEAEEAEEVEGETPAVDSAEIESEEPAAEDPDEEPSDSLPSAGRPE